MEIRRHLSQKKTPSAVQTVDSTPPPAPNTISLDVVYQQIMLVQSPSICETQCQLMSTCTVDVIMLQILQKHSIFQL